MRKNCLKKISMNPLYVNYLKYASFIITTKTVSEIFSLFCITTLLTLKLSFPFLSFVLKQPLAIFKTSTCLLLKNFDIW